MPLVKDNAREYIGSNREDYPIAAGALIFEGAAVGENAAGYARPLQAGDIFLGFAERRADNTNGAAGAIVVETRRRGRIELNVAGLVLADNDGAAVYASDDDTFNKTALGNSFIGYVSRFVSAGRGVVDFDAALIKAA